MLYCLNVECAPWRTAWKPNVRGTEITCSNQLDFVQHRQRVPFDFFPTFEPIFLFIWPIRIPIGIVDLLPLGAENATKGDMEDEVESDCQRLLPIFRV